MDWQAFLFSTSGRISRAHYWLAMLIYLAVAIVSVLIGLFLLFNLTDLTGVILYVGAGIIFIAMLFSAIAVGIKRLHDREKSGWWTIPFITLPALLGNAANSLVDSAATAYYLSLISGVLALWGIVELGFLRGTPGPNRFGADPVDQKQGTSVLKP